MSHFLGFSCFTLLLYAIGLGPCLSPLGGVVLVLLFTPLGEL